MHWIGPESSRNAHDRGAIRGLVCAMAPHQTWSRRLRPVIPTLVVALLAATGCGGGGSASLPGAPPPPPPPPPPHPPRHPPERAERGGGGGAAGGVLLPRLHRPGRDTRPGNRAR